MHNVRPTTLALLLIAIALLSTPPLTRAAALPVANPAAATPSWVILVTQGGIQRISGAALAAAGLDIATAAPGQLRLIDGGGEVALDLVGMDDGRIDPSDELRFYAPSPGDRWNRDARYWLTVDQRGGARIAGRAVPPGTAPLTTVAAVTGTWRRAALYDSRRPGPDADHWFAADLRVEPTLPGEPPTPATVTATLTPTLPLASGAMTVTLRGTAITDSYQTLSVALGDQTRSAAFLSTISGDWQQSVIFGQPASALTISLVPGLTIGGLLVDSASYTYTGSLDFAGGAASFQGAARPMRYQLANLPPDLAVYDITDVRAPQRLTAIAAGIFEDQLAGRVYQVAGAMSPMVAQHAPIDLLAPQRASALYIAPAVLQPALAPLIERRAAQGYAPLVVDLQAIYDTWSYGQVSPEAIRSFLRTARASWPAPPIAVTLVGDGTSDPFDNTQRGPANVNMLPPYLANADPGLFGETACEFCYAQLDGDDPLSDNGLDIWLGRLPVKSGAELSAVVAKIIGYETATAGGPWRGRMAFIADDKDSAGDFAALAERAIAEQPQSMSIAPVFYDKLGAIGGVRSAADAQQQTSAAFNSGAALVMYIGHAHERQWAVTDSASPVSWMLSLNDVDALRNGDRLPVVLSMTCLTGAFQTPLYTGTSLDERLLLKPSGGAIAVWGSSGLGVVLGHSALEQGFFRTLWSAPAATNGERAVPLGQLTSAGIAELFASAPGFSATAHTFGLLGDPLTPLRIAPARTVALPLVSGRP